MRLEQAFSMIQDIDAEVISQNLTWNSINMWPLMRQCLWFELIQATELTGKRRSANTVATVQTRTVNRIAEEIGAFRNRPPTTGMEATAFISRPVYLQALPNANLFDRILDPLIFCMAPGSLHEKYYVAPWPKGSKLSYPAALLRPFRFLCPEIPEAHRSFLVLVARKAGIRPKRLLWRYGKGLKAFDRWLKEARHFFDSRKNLKTVYLTSWYFPDMMALVAAARERGIKTIEVQHGKQGKLQAMYSGWRIPEASYQMMPDIFWNWGKPSAEHILATSADRRSHRPIVGGYPWLDYYRQYIFNTTTLANQGKKKRVLITIQSPQADNRQPIPNFMVDFLRDSSSDVHFLFRCHPNHQSAAEYCRRRLSELPPDLYDIDDGRGNLYDQLISATHHITAYSSCCYEAAAFGVPTLLFGADALTIYSDEIESGTFSWTSGRASDLRTWLEMENPPDGKINSEYINSSLEHTAAILRRAEFGEFEYHAIEGHSVV